MKSRIIDGKFYLPLQKLKKSMVKDIEKEQDVAGNTKLATALVDGMIQFFIENDMAEIRKDEKTGKEYISINEENWSEDDFGECPKVNVTEQLKRFGLRG